MTYFKSIALFIKASILVFALISCGMMRRHTTSDFAVMSDVKELNGLYLNRMDRISILSCFNIKEYADFVTLASENPNEIKLIYHNDSTKQEVVFSGQMKQNYFEIYFSKKQFFIPLLYSSINVDRVRIGRSKDGKLLIRKFIDNSGNRLILAGGYSHETPYIFFHSCEYEYYMPIQKNELWGYSDSLGNIVISPKYDFATIFKHDVARVKLDGKWGLINKQGVEVIPLKYDKVFPFDTLSPPTFRVSIFGKIGVFDMNGNELIPVIYDHIDSYASQGLVRIRLKDKWGYASRTQVVIPAIYTETYSLMWTSESVQFLVKRNGKLYIADGDGYEYETYRGMATSKYQSGLWETRFPVLETKRKIQIEEQEICK